MPPLSTPSPHHPSNTFCTYSQTPLSLITLKYFSLTVPYITSLRKTQFSLLYLPPPPPSLAFIIQAILPLCFAGRLHLSHVLDRLIAYLPLHLTVTLFIWNSTSTRLSTSCLHYPNKHSYPHTPTKGSPHPSPPCSSALHLITPHPRRLPIFLLLPPDKDKPGDSGARRGTWRNIGALRGAARTPGDTGACHR